MNAPLFMVVTYILLLSWLNFLLFVSIGLEFDIKSITLEILYNRISTTTMVDNPVAHVPFFPRLQVLPSTNDEEKYNNPHIRVTKKGRQVKIGLPAIRVASADDDEFRRFLQSQTKNRER